VTDAPDGIEKLFQLISAFLLVWLMIVCDALGLVMVALPTATVPPAGLAIAAVETIIVEPTMALVASNMP
jgi:hypothetical protein